MPKKKSSWKSSSRRRRRRRKPTTIVRPIVYVLIGLFLSLYAIHFFQVGSFFKSASMVANDVKVVGRCPHEPRNIWGFITRSKMEASAEFATGLGLIAMMQSGTLDFRELACSGGYN